MAGRQHRDRFAGHVDPTEDARGLGNTRQAQIDQLRIKMLEMQVDVVGLGAYPAALADLHGHGAADHVAAGQILGRRRIALHETLALTVGEIASLAAHPLGD